jgi:hypothetical protein
MRNFAVTLDQLCVIDIGSKASLYRFKVGGVTVARNLHAVRQLFRQIADEFDRSRAAPIAAAPRWD